jgi:hypothetical protein
MASGSAASSSAEPQDMPEEGTITTQWTLEQVHQAFFFDDVVW